MISVVMCINRFDLYVMPAINSILNQTYTEFELIIVANGNNASEIAAIIKKKEVVNKKNIRVIETSIGQLGFSLNLAISESKYDIIARMDSDDISLPQRPELQIKYLQLNELDLVGSAINLIDEDDNFFEVENLSI
nr:colanic acid biosynthesis glycosyltransferase WcaA [Citrobacter werkmanii]